MSDEKGNSAPEIYISKKYTAMEKALVPDFFAAAWELLCFAASIGWELRVQREIPTKADDSARSIRMDKPGRGDALMADLIGVLEAVADEEEDQGQQAMVALSSESYSERCRKLNTYAHGGFAYIEQLKQQAGTFRDTVEKIIADGDPDPAVLAIGIEN